MGLVTVTYSCGCEGRVQAFGRVADRQRFAQRAHGDRLCRECWEAKRDADLLTAQHVAAEQALPELIGSEKQVAWATSIRNQTIPKLREVPVRPGREVEAEVLISRIVNETSASVWIDRRHETAARLLAAEQSRMSQVKAVRFPGELPAEIRKLAGLLAGADDEHVEELIHVLRPANEPLPLYRVFVPGKDRDFDEGYWSRFVMTLPAIVVAHNNPDPEMQQRLKNMQVYAVLAKAA